MVSRPSRQLGAILRGVPAATVSSTAEPATPLAASGEVVSPIAEAELPEVSKPVGPEVPLQVTVPKRIRQQLMVMAAEQDCSVRALVLRAVTTLGIEVAEDELRDKRRKP